MYYVILLQKHLLKKGRDKGIMVSDFIDEIIWLVEVPADCVDEFWVLHPGAYHRAASYLEYSKDNHWDNDKLMKQMDKMITILNFVYPDVKTEFVVYTL